jgi:hypothetical protein
MLVNNQTATTGVSLVSLLSILEVVSSILNIETDYILTVIFHSFPQYLRVNDLIVP